MGVFLLNEVKRRKELKRGRKDVCMCGSCFHIHVEMDGGDVMSGIDPLLNMAPTHHNDDVSMGVGGISCCINT